MSRSTSTGVRIWWDKDLQAYQLQSSFNEALRDLLSKKIPISDRSYDERSRIWTFTERILPFVQELLKLFNVVPQLTTRSQAEATYAASQARGQASNGASSSRSPLELSAVEFLKLIPFGDAQKAYRSAQLVHHPDRGGSSEQSARLNAAWDRIKREVYNQQ